MKCRKENFTEQKKFSNFDLNIGNFHWIIFRLYSFIFLPSYTHRKQYMSDHHMACHITSSINILHNWSRLIACDLKANIHRGVISNTYAHENHWKVVEDSYGKASTNLWKWRNRAIAMHTAGCCQQDVEQQFNVHLSTINRLLSRFQVKRQVSGHRRHRRQLKTVVRRDGCIATTSRSNCFVSASKVAKELHPMSGVRKSDQSVKNRLLQDVNLRARRPRVAVHLTYCHRQTHVAWATTRIHWTLRQWNAVLFTDE
jgi:transposase